MTPFFRRHRPLLLWLTAAGLLLALFLLTRDHQPLMTFLVDHVTQPAKNAIGAVCYLVPIPLAELLYIAAGLWVMVHIIRSAILIRRAKGRRWDTACRRLLILLCAALTALDWFCLAWGINYYADGFQDKSGIRAQQVSTEELYRVVAYFTEQVNLASRQVPRDENGLFAVSRDEIFSHSTEIYPCIYEEFPFLSRQDRTPKRMLFSQLLSAMGFTGYYAPFTGESVLNVDSPEAYLPSTIVHELAHQRGFASEQECNFISIVVSTRCGLPAYVYSGYLIGYVHLSNALYRADRALWETLRGQLDEEVLLDIRNNSLYWQKWESPVDTVSQKAYDTLLKGYGQTAGVPNYGTVVDLLVAYY